MKIRLTTLYLGGFFALAPFMAQPGMADEWNKRTEFQFSGPVEIPGTVLPAGKYVFQLADSDSNRNIVQVFSEDSSGKDSLVTTVMAVPDYMLNTPDKPIVNFEERSSGTPEAIRSWFYPGENTGWEFVYPKSETVVTSANTTPATAPVTAAATPALPDAPKAQQEVEPTAEEVAVEEEVTVAQNDTPAPPAAQEADTQDSADVPMLPETGGYSEVQLLAGLAMLGGGLAVLAASLRKVRA
jgi:hypothetical protein